MTMDDRITEMREFVAESLESWLDDHGWFDQDEVNKLITDVAVGVTHTLLDAPCTHWAEQTGRVTAGQLRAGSPHASSHTCPACRVATEGWAQFLTGLPAQYIPLPADHPRIKNRQR